MVIVFVEIISWKFSSVTNVFCYDWDVFDRNSWTKILVIKVSTKEYS